MVGVLTVVLYIREADSLKYKRRIIKSLLDRCRNKFNVSVAETGSNDSLKHCRLSAAAVSNERRHLESTLTHLKNFISEIYEIDIIESEMEIW